METKNCHELSWVRYGSIAQIKHLTLVLFSDGDQEDPQKVQIALADFKKRYYMLGSPCRDTAPPYTWSGPDGCYELVSVCFLVKTLLVHAEKVIRHG